MMSQHFSSMFEQIGNFTKNNLVTNNKLVKEKENKANANHVSLGAAGAGGNQQASPHKHAQPPPPLRKPCKLRNLTSKAESYDTLYSNSTLQSNHLTTLALFILKNKRCYSTEFLVVRATSTYIMDET
ncbi:unnamed protein product [Parnassius mnemosyne]|uniref:Uncharacterized protein n=1 Tax=Parnassius mnemosyne TaxID=213953 RepID=A0AAV1KIR5_9NEOP